MSASPFAEMPAETIADHLDRGQRLRVVHPGRPQDADGADVLAVAPPRARRPPSRRPAARRRARHRSPPTGRGSSTSRTSETMTYCCSSVLQHGAHRVDRVERLRHRRRCRRRTPARACRSATSACMRPAHSSSTSAIAAGRAGRRAVERRARRARAAGAPWPPTRAARTASPASSIGLVLDRCRWTAPPPRPPTRADRPTTCTERTTARSRRAGRRPATAWRVSCASRFEVWCSISSRRPWAASKKSPTRCAADDVEPTRRGHVVDEEAVALVGGDATGRRVRLDQVALLLEHGHLVAHGGRADLHARRVGDVGRPDRLRGGDVLLHDRPQDGCLAFVEHVRRQCGFVTSGWW